MKNQLSLLSDQGSDEYNHETLFRWGLHKGKQMRDILSEYLIGLYNSKTIAGPLRTYLTNNLELIKNKFKPLTK
jgi:hypothetical protein